MTNGGLLKPAVFISAAETFLCCFFCGQGADRGAITFAVYHFHLLPVVGKLFPAVHANHIGPGRKCSATPGSLFDCDRKAVPVVPAAEERINDASKHPSTSHRMPQRPGKPDEVAFIYLDSASLKRVRRTGGKIRPGATMGITRGYLAEPSGPVFLWDLQRLAMADLSLVSRSSGSSYSLESR
jgi:hypothetical protein